MKLSKNIILGFFSLVYTLPVQATPDDYSKAAGHTGVYVNVNNVYALKCKIKTYDHSNTNNKLGWYTAWPMIVDYDTNKFIQIGYITSPLEKIKKPTFYVSWSSDGKQINTRYLPDKNSVGNALAPKDEHEYALSLNMDGTANIQIDGVKYLDSPEEMIETGISQGTGEFFSEASNLGMDITTEFKDCSYKLRGDTEWVEIDKFPSSLLYYANTGTLIQKSGKSSLFINGTIKKINKGRFFKKVNIIKK